MEIETQRGKLAFLRSHDYPKGHSHPLLCVKDPLDSLLLTGECIFSVEKNALNVCESILKRV